MPVMLFQGQRFSDRRCASMMRDTFGSESQMKCIGGGHSNATSDSREWSVLHVPPSSAPDALLQL